jgi:hypothetical protein
MKRRIKKVGGKRQKKGNPPQDCPNTSNQRFTLHKQCRLAPATLPTQLNSAPIKFRSSGEKQTAETLPQGENPIHGNPYGREAV